MAAQDGDLRRQSAVTLERGLAILAMFGRERGPLGLTEVARRVEMRPNTAHRYLRTLRNLGYLRQDSRTLKYRLDVKAADLGLAAINSLDARETARPHLRRLCEDWGVTVNMAVRDGAEIVYVERIIGKRSMDLPISVGSRQPAYCTSMGKVLLAFMDEADLEKTLREIDLVSRGPKTITDPLKLAVELGRVRKNGYAINNEELARGLRSVAAPIRDAADSVIAAINLHASPFSSEEIRDSLAPAVVATGDAISRELGARSSAALSDTR